MSDACCSNLDWSKVIDEARMRGERTPEHHPLCQSQQIINTRHHEIALTTFCNQCRALFFIREDLTVFFEWPTSCPECGTEYINARFFPARIRSLGDKSLNWNATAGEIQAALDSFVVGDNACDPALD